MRNAGPGVSASAWADVATYLFVMIFDVCGIMHGLAGLADLSVDGNVPGALVVSGGGVAGGWWCVKARLGCVSGGRGCEWQGVSVVV